MNRFLPIQNSQLSIEFMICFRLSPVLGLRRHFWLNVLQQNSKIVWNHNNRTPDSMMEPQQSATTSGPEESSCMSRWTVTFLISNKRNTHIDTVALNEDRTMFSVKLYDSVSESILWEEKESWYESLLNPCPCFNEDGTYFGVYISNRLLILASDSGRVTITCVPPSWESPTAIAISSNGNRFAMSVVGFRIARASSPQPEPYTRTYKDQDGLDRRYN
jgi:hypothetical protein